MARFLKGKTHRNFLRGRSDMLKQTIFILLFLYTAMTQAQTKAVNICIGKKAGKVFQVRKQLNQLTVDGVTSQLSTFWYKGQVSVLKLDFDEANVTARCHSPGSDIFNFTFSINGRTKVHKLTARVNCIYCLPKRLMRMKQKLIKLAEKIMEVENRTRRNKLKEQMHKITKKLIQEINKELKKENLPEDLRELLVEQKKILLKLLELIAEDAVDSELFHYYLSKI